MVVSNPFAAPTRHDYSIRAIKIFSPYEHPNARLMIQWHYYLFQHGAGSIVDVFINRYFEALLNSTLGKSICQVLERSMQMYHSTVFSLTTRESGQNRVQVGWHQTQGNLKRKCVPICKRTGLSFIFQHSERWKTNSLSPCAHVHRGASQAALLTYAHLEE